MPETINNPDGTRLRIFRLFIECCAAGARSLSIPIEFREEPPGYEEMGWVKVVGKMHYSKEGEEIVPVINVETREPTAEPIDWMLTAPHESRKQTRISLSYRKKFPVSSSPMLPAPPVPVAVGGVPGEVMPCM